MSALNRRQTFAIHHLVDCLALVLNPWQLWKRTVIAIRDLLPPVEVLYISRVLQVRTRAVVRMLIRTMNGVILTAVVTYHSPAASTAALVLVRLSILVDARLPSNRPTAVLLSVHESHSRDRVRIVVRVLVASFDELLLGLFESQRTDQALSITRNVDVRHIARVVDARLSLQVVSALVVVSAIIQAMVHLNWLLTMTLVNGVLSPLAVKVLLARY